MRIIPDNTGYVAVYKDELGNQLTIPLIGWAYEEEGDLNGMHICTMAVVPGIDGHIVPCTEFKGTDGELTFEGLDCGHFAEDEDQPDWGK